jgi:tetratricopeptide (TPR) repeat protein
MSEFWSAEKYDREAQRRYESGDLDGALEIIRRGLSLFPKAAELHVSEGYAQLAREEFVWARRSFEAALALTADNEDALVGLGEVLLKMGERARAYGLFERILELGHRDDVDLMLSVGRSLFREGLYDAAERFYRYAMAAGPEVPDAVAELAYTLERKGELHEARILLQSALEGSPDHHEARLCLGNLLYELGHYLGSFRELVRVPVEVYWDALAVWRAIELLRCYRGLAPDSDELVPYFAKLRQLRAEGGPEAAILQELLNASAGESVPGEFANPDQLDLFGHTSGTRSPIERHQVRVPSGRLYMGDWVSIVCDMRSDSADAQLSMTDYMRRAAQRVRERLGIELPSEDPEAFLKASALAGILQIEA